MMDVSITPASAQPPSSAAVQKAKPSFSLTPKKLVENFNKAAKTGKSTQRATLGQTNDGATQVVVSKNTGMLLTTNADGKVNSVMHVGTGDGTPESGTNIMLGMAFAIGSVKPGWTGPQCFDVLKKLGFGSGPLPESSSVVVDGVLFEFKMSEAAGVWLIITPQAQR